MLVVENDCGVEQCVPTVVLLLLLTELTACENICWILHARDVPDNDLAWEFSDETLKFPVGETMRARCSNRVDDWLVVCVNGDAGSR